jgi:hypothetical protein
MSFGMLLGAIGLVVRGQFGAVSIYSDVVAIPYYLWAILTIGFYGHDLYLAVQRASAPNQASHP